MQVEYTQTNSAHHAGPMADSKVEGLTAADAEPECGNPTGDGNFCAAPKGHPWDCITGEVFEEEPQHKSETCGKGPSTNPCMQGPDHDGDCDWKLGTEEEASVI